MPLYFNPHMPLSEEVKDLFRNAYSIPIIPRAGLYLRCDAGNGSRCAVQIRETWKRLPLSARRRLLRFWRAGGPVNHVCPGFELTAHWSHQDGETFGASCQEHHVIRLWSPGIDILPEPFVQVVVAHEVSHAYLAALGKRYERTPEEKDEYYQNGNAYLFDEEEMDARAVTEEWGFDEDDLDRWFEANHAILQQVRQEWETGTAQ